MNSFLVLAALLAAAVSAEVPQSWRPSGRLLLLPAPAPLQSPPQAQQENSTPQNSESVSERLVDNGEYYLLLPDGRLQMVTYTLQLQLQQQQQPEPLAQWRLEYLQYPLSTAPATTAPATAQLPTDADSVTETILQYRYVRPISGPVYSYDPAAASPVRVLRK